MSEEADIGSIALAAEIVAAYVSNNSVQVSDLPALISSIHGSLVSIASGQAVEPEPAQPIPAVPVKKSIASDYLISLEDGRKYKTLKRHLTGLGLTPEGYRAKWGLKPDYPMIAPAYAARRSELAKASGLGQWRSKVAPEPAPATPKRTRKPKVTS